MTKKYLLWFTIGIFIHAILFLLVYYEEIFQTNDIRDCSLFIIIYALLNSLIIGACEPWFQTKQRENPAKKQWHLLSWSITFGLPMGFLLYIQKVTFDLPMAFLLYFQQVAIQEIVIWYFFLSLVIGLLSGLLVGYLWSKIITIPSKENNKA